MDDSSSCPFRQAEHTGRKQHGGTWACRHEPHFYLYGALCCMILENDTWITCVINPWDYKVRRLWSCSAIAKIMWQCKYQLSVWITTQRQRKSPLTSHLSSHMGRSGLFLLECFRKSGCRRLNWWSYTQSDTVNYGENVCFSWCSEPDAWSGVSSQWCKNPVNPTLT